MGTVKKVYNNGNLKVLVTHGPGCVPRAAKWILSASPEHFRSSQRAEVRLAAQHTTESSTMDDRDLVLRLVALGVEAAEKGGDFLADPSGDAVLSGIGVAAIASWLEELGKLQLVGRVEPSFGSGSPTLVYQVTAEAQQLWKDQDALADRLKTLFPSAPPRYDVFISYTGDDSHIAAELRESLLGQKLSCFMAEKDIPAASDWSDEIRDALHGSTYVILLLTQRSKDRPWVLLEAGAAWALKRKIIPVCNQVNPADLLDPIRRHQARIVETSKQRLELAKEIAGYTGNAAG